MVWSADKMISAVRLWTTWTTMPLKVVAPSFNSALVTMLSNLEGLKGTIAQSVGVPPSEINYTYSDLLFGMKEWSKLQGEYIAGTYKTNKLWLAMRDFDYMTNSYDVRIIRKQSVVGEPAAYDTANLFATYKIGEDFGIYTILAAQMRHQKVKEGSSLSMWDAYSVKDGKLTFDENVIRGYIKNADGTYSELRAFTDREIFKMKRVYEMQQGGYRKSEMTLIQQTAAGKLLMQFKQYMPTILNNVYSGKYKDYSLADLKIIPDELHEGENVYDYVDRLNEGRMLVLLKMIWSYSRMAKTDAYRYKNLSNEQKQQFILVMETLGVLTIAIAATLAGADDDEPDTPLAQRTRRLFMEDVTQGMNPVDILRNVMTPIASISKLFNATTGGITFLTQGVVMGKETTEGKPVGYANFSKSVPGLATFAEIDRYFKKSTKASEYDWMFGYNLKEGLKSGGTRSVD
jgi:hypothetical protein